MKLIVTGAEQSGTGLVATLFRLAGAEVTHRAIPHLDDHWPLYNVSDDEDVGPDDAIVFVARHHTPQEASQRARSHRELSTADEAIVHAGEYATLKFDTPFFVVTYEAIIHEWPHSFTALCDELGLDPTPALGYDVRDENRKHYR